MRKRSGSDRARQGETGTSQARRTEWGLVAICVAAMLVLTSVPYLFGYLVSPSDRVFMGIVTGTPDTAQYLAWMKGFETANLIDNHLTPEPSAAVFFNLLWWTLGKLAAILPLGPMAVIHVYRVFSIVSFSVVLYWFIGFSLPERPQRLAAFLVAYFGGGLGWIWVVAKYTVAKGELLFPRDVYVVEANSFMSAMGVNHFTFSAALMILIYALFALGCQRRQWRYPAGASLLALVLGWEHAYDLLLVYAVLGTLTFVLLLRDGFSHHLVFYPLTIGLVSIWSALYSLYITRAFPVWTAVLAQFENAGAWTPDPLHLLILLGLPFIVALAAFDGLLPLGERSVWELLVRVWFGVNLFVVYVPLDFQIHYLNGWQVPIAILSSAAFSMHILPWVRRQAVFQSLAQAWTAARLERVVLSLVLLSVILVNVYMLVWRLLVLTRVPHGNFLYRDEMAALEWLADDAEPGDVVLSGAEVGQYVPSQVGARAFLAHWAMTVDLHEKQRMVRAFYSLGTPDDERKAVLRRFSVDYVFLGAEERALGDYDPADATYLEACFVSPEAAVYRVQDGELALVGR